MGQRIVEAAAHGYLHAEDMLSRITAADAVATGVDAAREDMFVAGTITNLAQRVVWGTVLQAGVLISPEVIPASMDRRELTTRQLAHIVVNRLQA